VQIDTEEEESMADVMLVMLLVVNAMFWVSLISPRFGLFFAAPLRQTRLWGVVFWFLACITSFLLFGLATDHANNSKTPTGLVITTIIAVLACVALIVKLRGGAREEWKSTPFGEIRIGPGSVTSSTPQAQQKPRQPLGMG